MGKMNLRKRTMYAGFDTQVFTERGPRETYVVRYSVEVGYRGRRNDTQREKALDKTREEVRAYIKCFRDELLEQQLRGMNEFMHEFVNRWNQDVRDDLERLVREDDIVEDFCLEGLSDDERTRHHESVTEASQLWTKIEELEKRAREEKAVALALRRKGVASQLQKMEAEAETRNCAAALRKVREKAEEMAAEKGSDRQVRPRRASSLLTP